MKPRARFKVQAQQSFAKALFCFFFGAEFLFHNRNPGARCQTTHRFRKIDVFVLHQELKHSASGPTPVAVVRLLRWIDVKRRGLLLVKGTKRPEFGSRSPERTIAPDY